LISSGSPFFRSVFVIELGRFTSYDTQQPGCRLALDLFSLNVRIPAMIATNRAKDGTYVGPMPYQNLTRSSLL